MVYAQWPADTAGHPIRTPRGRPSEPHYSIDVTGFGRDRRKALTVLCMNMGFSQTHALSMITVYDTDVYVKG
jgi:hypothetical protein